MKKYQSFLSENFQFSEVKFSIYLNSLVFVMVYATVVSYVALVLSMFVPHRSHYENTPFQTY